VKEEVKVVELDRSQQGMTLAALAEYRNQQKTDGQCTALVEEVIKKVFDAPVKIRKVRNRDDAR